MQIVKTSTFNPRLDKLSRGDESTQERDVVKTLGLAK